MYEIARTRLGGNGSRYLNALKAFSTPEGFIPEQVWNETATPVAGWEVELPAGYAAGTPTKSIAPLNWAMGEYINLLAAINANRVTETASVVCMRYNACEMEADAAVPASTDSAWAPAARRWPPVRSGAAGTGCGWSSSFSTGRRRWLRGRDSRRT